ncbi:MAG: PTS system fructose-specific EIIABC component [Candidatus Omnitrophica bacterium ADurb.Bin277]|nr:MAG: PTS system fructose-specific EIIABC component [Candidatus Omnitrophica bacterium ADurb.Bin277]
MLRPLLTEESVVPGLCCVNFEDALGELVEALPKWRITSEAKARILSQLIQREKLGTTAIGGGVALPHCFSTEITDPIGVFGVSPDGIPYPSLDGRPVHFVFMLVLPQSEAAEIIKRTILRSIRWILCDRSLKEQLKMARSAIEILSVLKPRTAHEPVLGVGL